MSIRPEKLKKIYQIIQPLLNQKPWRVQKGIGTFLLFDFGNRRFPIPEKFPDYFIGEWHLWIYLSYWLIAGENKVLVGAEDPTDQINDVLSSLEKRKLIDVQITLPCLETVFIFEGPIRLTVVPNAIHNDDIYWMLFTPGDKVLSIGTDSEVSYAFANGIENVDFLSN